MVHVNHATNYYRTCCGFEGITLYFRQKDASLHEAVKSALDLREAVRAAATIAVGREGEERLVEAAGLRVGGEAEQTAAGIGIGSVSKHEVRRRERFTLSNTLMNTGEIISIARFLPHQVVAVFETIDIGQLRLVTGAHVEAVCFVCSILFTHLPRSKGKSRALDVNTTPVQAPVPKHEASRRSSLPCLRSTIFLELYTVAAQIIVK